MCPRTQHVWAARRSRLNIERNKHAKHDRRPGLAQRRDGQASATTLAHSELASMWCPEIARSVPLPTTGPVLGFSEG